MTDKSRYRYGLLAAVLAVVLLAGQPCMALVVTEVMYHPVEDDGTPDGEESLEFIELYNNRAVFEDLGNWAFTNGINFHFPAGTILPAKDCLVVARDPNALRLAYPELPEEKIFGPFELNDAGTKQSSLNNDGERVDLSDHHGQIVITFRYNDTWPWPNSPDGTGHSLNLAKRAGDPEESSSWAPSTYIGGTPGELDYFQVKPAPPPAPPVAEPTTAWTEIDFDDDPGTTAWIEAPSGYGYSNENNELAWIETELPGMRYNYISVYARLPFTLTQNQIDSFSELQATVHYDDAFVLYLNGVRVGDSGNIAGNPPPYSQNSTTASDYVGGKDFDLTPQRSLLVAGDNVLAVQGHNTNIGSSSDFVLSPILWGVHTGGTEMLIDLGHTGRYFEGRTEPSPEFSEPEPEPGPVGKGPQERLVINELLSNSSGADWLEIYNPGPNTVDLTNVYLSDGRFELVDEYRFPAVVMQPGEFRTVGESALGFKLSSTGDTVFVTQATDDPIPQLIRVLDAVRFRMVEEGVTLGRYPDGADNFVAQSAPTQGGANAGPRINDIVINEIMYHHGTRDDSYEYIELYNRGGSTVSLSGWAFTDGVDFTFAGTQMASGSYLVIAKDPATLESVYDNLVIGTNLLGPYTGRLDNHSERIRLSYPNSEGQLDNEGNLYMITADKVTYYDGGRWPSWANGMGTSMELRDPDSDNNAPDAWADSDESTKAVWEQFSFTVNGSDPDYTHDQVTIFDFFLLNTGEILIDDLELIIQGTERLTNGGFESGEADWDYMIGNHVQSHVITAEGHDDLPSNVLHLIATGHGDPGANRINQLLNTSPTGGTVTFRGWARWLRGSRYLLLRTTRVRAPVQPPRPARSFELDMPLNQGTPGEQNTAYVANRGPDINETKHSPTLPVENQDIVVTARVTDNDGVGAVTLYYRSEGSSGFTSTPMVDDASGNDAIAGDSIFTGMIPGAGANTMRAFYIEASDGSASTRFPTVLQPTADVPDRTCLVRVGDTLVNSEFATYRIWMSKDVIDVFDSANRPNLSNELMDCTFVYDDTDVFYNASLRYRGSPFIRGGSGWNPIGRRPYRIEFNPDQNFGDREEINLDRTEGSNRGPLQERASYWFYEKMGLQYSRQEYVRPIMNGSSHANYEDVRKIDGEYIDAWWPNDNEGRIHKIDDYFEYNLAGTDKRNLDEGLKYDSRHPLLKETYRWGFEKRSHREDDNWDHLFDFAVAMNTPSSDPGYEQAIESVIHPEHFARVLAIRHAVGDWDSYGYNRGKNNYFYYAMPEGKWYLLPWDIDFTLGSGNGTGTNLFSVNTGQFPEVYQFFNYPKYRRMYLQAFAELVNGPWQTSYGTPNPPTAFDRFLDDAADALAADPGGDASRRNSIKQFVRDRRAYILMQIPSFIFEITTNSGNGFCTSGSTVTISGVAPLEVAGISVNGTPLPSEFSGNNTFEVDVPIDIGTTLLVLQGLDGVGNFVEGATDSITVTRIPVSMISSVAPSTLCNTGTAQLTIHGSGFEPGSATTVAVTVGSDEIGFDALYVQNSASFDRIDAATVLLDDPSGGVGDPVEAVHPVINLLYSGGEGVFAPSDAFAPPFNSGDPANFAVRFTGYIYAASPGVRYFGVNSDDGFSLWINDQLVGEYANARAAATSDVNGNLTAGTMTFDFPTEGTYFLQLDFFENGGGEEIEFFQTNATGGNRRLINVDSELIVYRDDVARIDATNVVVVDENTITCQVDVNGAKPGVWNVIVTPECGHAARSEKDGAFQIIIPPANSIDWTVSPVDTVDSSGSEGGWFSPNQHSFVISNTGSTRLNWSVTKDALVDWLDLPGWPFGTLSPARQTSTIVSVNAVAQTLPPGTYTCPLVFSVGCNPGGDSEYRRQVRLTVTYRSDFDDSLTVGVSDLVEMADKWLDPCSGPGWCGGIDLDFSEHVGLGDLAIFAGEWMLTVP